MKGGAKSLHATPAESAPLEAAAQETKAWEGGEKGRRSMAGSWRQERCPAFADNLLNESDYYEKKTKESDDSHGPFIYVIFTVFLERIK